MSKLNKLYPSVYYSEDKNMVAIVITSGNPIKEAEFLAAMYDWVKQYGDGFSFADDCTMVDCEIEIDIDEDYKGQQLN